MLRPFAGKIQKGLTLLVRRRPAISYLNEELEAVTVVPDNVMEGHFVVLAIKGKEIKRFIVELDNLTDPAFIGLLDRARDKYGFRQKGGLTVPYQPQELQKILDDWQAEITQGGGCAISNISSTNIGNY